jgi:hypothetical protein
MKAILPFDPVSSDVLVAALPVCTGFALVPVDAANGAYDYFWFIGQVNGVWAGIWIGALVALVVGIMLSKKAIKIHQDASPFQLDSLGTDDPINPIDDSSPVS